MRPFAAFAAVFTFSFPLAWADQAARPPLPPGAVSIVNQDRFGSHYALCVETDGQPVQRGAQRIRATEVWTGETDHLHKLSAGLGACDPAWSPDGRRLAVTAAAGLWVFPAQSSDGTLRVQAKVPLGGPTEFTYRAFSHPDWSSDGALIALVVTNGGTSWVEAFQASTGKLFYTSPPETYTFSWGAGARDLKAGNVEIRLPAHR